MNLLDIFKKITDEKIKLDDFTKKLLTEDDDFGGDAGDDMGDAPAPDDPFGGDDGDPFGDDSSGGSDGDDANSEDGEDDGENEDEDDPDGLDLENHKDDPEFTQGKNNSEDLTLPDKPAGKSVLSIEKVLQNLKSLINSLSTEQLVEYELFKKCVELICNGKILNEEDLEFKNIDNAIFLLDKICVDLDIKTRAYLLRKFKEPLITKRDKIKEEIAKQQGELDSTRNLVIKLDTFDNKKI